MLSTTYLNKFPDLAFNASIDKFIFIYKFNGWSYITYDIQLYFQTFLHDYLHNVSVFLRNIPLGIPQTYVCQHQISSN